MDDKFKAGILIIAVLATLESIAIVTGTNGAYFAPVIALIGGVTGALFGFSLKRFE